MKYMLIVVACINLYTFMLMRFDKRQSRKSRQRISEKSLMIHAIFIGSAGIYLGIYFPSPHKSHVLKFILGVPVIIFLQLALFIYIYKSIIIV